MTAEKRARAIHALAAEIGACRICRDTPSGRPLPQEPRPVVRLSATARIAICGQAPGTRVQATGIPFTDPSGDRLRQWMGVSPEEFYDTSRIAIVPMGFCFPGLDSKGSDRPPRKECAQTWHDRVFAEMPHIDLLLLVGSYSQAWHLGGRGKQSLTATVADWRHFTQAGPTRTHTAVQAFPLPHPSWRNSGWLKRHPWFEADLVPELRAAVRARLGRAG
jgi:uracil-DNA glycosylase